jgi:hypothetical protein
MSEKILFGFCANNSFDKVADLLSLVRQADSDGLDLVSMFDHPYIGTFLDTYATLGCTWARHSGSRASPTSPICRPGPHPCWRVR